MGVRSDAVLVMKKEVFEELQTLNNEWSNELIRMAKETVHGDNQVLLEYGYKKVYYSGPGNEFYDFACHFDEDDYLLYILNSEGVSEYGVDENDFGKLEPEWEIGYELEASITYY